MTPTLGRYLRGEIVAAFLMIATLLLIVLFGGLLTDVLSRIARGHFPASLLVPQLLLRIPQALLLLLPVAGFLAVLVALGRMYRESEMAVLAASGLATTRLLRPVLGFALPLALLLAGLGLYVAPISKRIAADMAERANRQLAVAGLEPGRFVELSASGTVVYADRYDEAGRALGEMLIIRQRQQLEVVRAAAGEVTTLPGGASQLRLHEGERASLTLGTLGLERSSFASAELVLPERMQKPRLDPVEVTQALELLGRGDRPARAELEHRLSPAWQALLLIALAPVLARAPPRQPSYGRIVVGILLFVVYSNLASLAKGWYALGAGPDWLGTLWVHVGVLAVAAALWWPSWRGERRARVG